MIDVVMLMCDFNQELSELTQETIFSLKQAPINNLIIVDNASAVGVGPARNEADIYVRNKTNKGYTGAVNQGMALTNSEYIAIANNDIRVSPNWVEVSQEILKDPTIASVHFKMIPYDEPMILGNETWTHGKERWCHASFYVIRREAIPEGKYFEGYKEGGYDDYDYFYRVRKNGWKTAYTNKAVFQHKDSSTYNALDQRDGDRSERDLKNRELYKERHGEYPDIQFALMYPEQMEVPWKPFP